MDSKMTGREFHIGGRVFEVRPPVLRQLQQASRLLAGVQPDAGLEGLMDALDEALPRFVAVALAEKGTDIRHKDLEELADLVAFEADGDTVMGVLQSFFAQPEAARQLAGMGNCRAMLAYAAGTEALLEKARARAAGQASESTSTGPWSSSPGETSPGATPSSTDSPRERSGHG